MGYHPWFEPLSRRLATLAFCLAWIGFEAWQEVGALWFWIAVAVAGYALYDLFLSGRYGRGGPPAGAA